MSNPFIGEIRLFGGNFAPQGWAFCNGQLQAISDNNALFSLLGTTYGGDGQSTFALPDLRGRVPIHQGQGAGLSSRILGTTGGSESVTLTLAQMPVHSHQLNASATAASAAAGPGGVLATPATQIYGAGTPTTPMDAAEVTPVGGNQPHQNMAPYQAVNFIISLFGIFPSQN